MQARPRRAPCGRERTPEERPSPAADEGLSPLQVASSLLLALDRLEQRLEVALAEAERAVAFDQLEEHRGSVLHRLGEDLQEVAVLVTVGQDLQLPQRFQRHSGVADPRTQLVVISVRRL